MLTDLMLLKKKESGIIPRYTASASGKDRLAIFRDGEDLRRSRFREQRQEFGFQNV